MATVLRDREENKKWKAVCRTYNGFLRISVSFKCVCVSSEPYNFPLKTKEYADVDEVH